MSQHYQTASRKFHLFHMLPREVQLYIWEVALPDPRIVHLKAVSNEAVNSATPVPALFSVCRDSREAVLKHYENTFQTVFSARTTWFDYQRDTLYIDDGISQLLHLLYLGSIGVKRLAIQVVPSRGGDYEWEEGEP